MAEFLDEIQTNVFRVFLLATDSHLYCFVLRFLFLQTHATSNSPRVQLLYTVKNRTETHVAIRQRHIIHVHIMVSIQKSLASRYLFLFISWYFPQSTHGVAIATFLSGWTKLPPGGRGGGVQAHTLSLYLPSRTRLWCELRVRGQIHSPYFYSTPICTLLYFLQEQ
jgi:hypothetical protein